MSERKSECCPSCGRLGDFGDEPCLKCKPAEPREERYAGAKIDKMIIDEYHDFKQDHPGRWPSESIARCNGKTFADLNISIDGPPSASDGWMACYEWLTVYAKQLEARAEAAEKELDEVRAQFEEAKRINAQWKDDYNKLKTEMCITVVSNVPVKPMGVIK